MVRIHGKIFGLMLPAVTAGFIRGKPAQRLEPLSEVIGHQEGLEVFLEMLVGLVGRLLHGGFFAGTIHAFHLTIGPGMVDFRETLVDAICLAEAIEEMLESILIASSDTASAPWGQH